MTTPVADFVRRYADSGTARLHMPGHKGRAFLGCEALDITEIDGADALYEAAGILAESEANAAALFGSGRTLYSTEGSSQCIRAMVYLAVTEWAAQHAQFERSCSPPPSRLAAAHPLNRGVKEATAYKSGKQISPLIIAGRNAHKSFLYAAALADAEILWLWPEIGNSLSETRNSLCSCPIAPEQLRRTLQSLSACQKSALAAVYLTSPDYLGGQLDIAALSAICQEFGAPLLVDNAHGAYLHFLDPPAHPLDLGAALCCDSAHKTLPVLTGGAYLHIAKNAPAGFRERAKSAMALFGSTSPSYLILSSLDLCNRYLSDNYPARLAETVRRLEELRARLRGQGWQVENSDPLRLTLRGGGKATGGTTMDSTITGNAVTDNTVTNSVIAERLRKGGIAWEYADRDYIVLMATPENTPEELDQIAAALGSCPADTPPLTNTRFPFTDTPPLFTDTRQISPLENSRQTPPLLRGGGKPEIVLSPRQALFAPSERIPAAQSIGRICGAPSVGCPPAIPIAIAGERIGEEAVRLFREYGVTEIEVLISLHRTTEKNM